MKREIMGTETKQSGKKNQERNKNGKLENKNEIKMKSQKMQAE